ncbi:cell-cycle control medial ring component [Diplogelasinospora grovesii]|uniref:Cell-cycle control medial ring component n=1 Tax=Diplogelasinospora grovesii TaxID=303347 RepID=A0AAN6SAB1_9PEZI|nr:cell-cycle control medial ring component [Diplogelasinospora grovesii]
MTEVSFAKAFLSALDGRPMKLSPEHVEDPRNYPTSTPYILPRHGKPMSKPTRPNQSRSAPGSERSITASLKPLRGTAFSEVRLTSLPLHTSVLDTKTLLADRLGTTPDKLKLLHNKKPVPDTKTLSDLMGDTEITAGTIVEFSVMVIGTLQPKPSTPQDTTQGEAGEEEDTHVAQGPHGQTVLATEQFWDDLKGFLQQRIRDEKTAEEVTLVFRGAWNTRT